MKKRMILTVGAMVVFIAAIGLVKFFQIRTAIAQSSSFQHAARGGDHGRGQGRGVAGDAVRHRLGGRRPGGHGLRRPARHRREDRVPIGRQGAEGGSPGAARHQPGARPARRRRVAAPALAAQPGAHARPAPEGRRLAGGVRPHRRGVTAGDGREVGDPRHDRAQADPGAVLRRPRHPPGEPRPVPERPAIRWCRCRRSTRSTSTSRCRSRSSGACGRAPRCASRPRARRAWKPPGKITAFDSVVDEATRNVQVQATFAEPGRRAAPRHVRRGPGRSSAPSLTVVRAPRLGDQLRPLRRLGVHRRGRQGARRPDLPRRAPAVRRSSARSRGDQVAVVSGLKPGEEVVTSGVFKLRHGAAVHGQQRGAARRTAPRRSRRTAE